MVYSGFPSSFHTLVYIIDNYAKDGGSEDVRLLRSSIKINVNKFAISHHMALKLSIRALRNYLKLPYQY